MIMTIQFLHRKKEGYKPETMHLAGNIGDRYLAYLARKGKRAPSMALLATTALLIAAKIEQPISPSFNRMITLLPESQRSRVTKPDLIDLEDQIVWALDFDFGYASPVTFLERYQRLLAIDQEDSGNRQIGHTARQFCKYMQRNSEFLEFSPSQQASAALVLSLNLSYSPVSHAIGLERLGEKFTTEYGEEFPILIDDSMDESASTFNLQSEDTEEPVAIWSTRMNELTKLSAGLDISPVYS